MKNRPAHHLAGLAAGPDLELAARDHTEGVAGVAFDLGVTTVETDLHLTGDGVPVLALRGPVYAFHRCPAVERVHSPVARRTAAKYSR